MNIIFQFLNIISFSFLIIISFFLRNKIGYVSMNYSTEITPGKEDF